MNEKDQPIDAEVVPPTQALAVRPEQPVQPGLFGTTQPAEVITKASEVATALKDVVKKQGLVSTISGKEYPRCEAWTLLGTMLGVFPVMCWTKKVEGGWEARVEARTKDGAVVGAAEAECLRAEKNWSNRDDFALRSMAQTRATAKALRMPLGFVMTLAGYEVTPAEEMVADHPPKPQEGPRPTAPPSKPAPAKKTPPAASSAQRQPDIGKYREKLIANLSKDNLLETALSFLRELHWLLPNAENLEHLEDRYVPATKEQYIAFLGKLMVFSTTKKAEMPYQPNYAEPIKEEKPADDYNSPDAPWRSYPVPFGKNAGVKLADLDKKVLFGFWANYQPQETWEDKEGKVHKTKLEKLLKDKHFRAMLDEAGKHYEFKEGK